MSDCSLPCGRANASRWRGASVRLRVSRLRLAYAPASAACCFPRFKPWGSGLAFGQWDRSTISSRGRDRGAHWLQDRCEVLLPLRSLVASSSARIASLVSPRSASVWPVDLSSLAFKSLFWAPPLKFRKIDWTVKIGPQGIPHQPSTPVSSDHLIASFRRHELQNMPLEPRRRRVITIALSAYVNVEARSVESTRPHLPHAGTKAGSVPRSSSQAATASLCPTAWLSARIHMT